MLTYKAEARKSELALKWGVAEIDKASKEPPTDRLMITYVSQLRDQLLRLDQMHSLLKRVYTFRSWSVGGGEAAMQQKLEETMHACVCQCMD